MESNKKKWFFIYLYLIFVVIVGRIVFILPNSKYMGILNVNNYFFVSSSLILLFFLVTMFVLKKNKNIIMNLNIVFSIFVFLLMGSVYYFGLPKYTYPEAGLMIKEQYSHFPDAEIIVPKYREDRLGYIKRSYLSTTNYSYYIYLKNGDQVQVFRVNPLTGEYTEHFGRMRAASPLNMPW